MNKFCFQKPNKLAKLSFTSLGRETHSVCLDNQGITSISIEVDITTGVRAKDYSHIISTEKMKELDYNIRMYED